MKFKFEVKDKKGSLEANVEKLVEKGMEQHERTWKDKFILKHNAKKEMLEIKHKQKLEIEENNQKKKSWFEKREEEKRKKRQLEIEEERRKEKERKKSIIVKSIISGILGIVGVTMMIIGMCLVSNSGDSESIWSLLIMIGMFICMSIFFLWTDNTDSRKKKRK